MEPGRLDCLSLARKAANQSQKQTAHHCSLRYPVPLPTSLHSPPGVVPGSTLSHSHSPLLPISRSSPMRLRSPAGDRVLYKQLIKHLDSRSCRRKEEKELVDNVEEKEDGWGGSKDRRGCRRRRRKGESRGGL